MDLRRTGRVIVIGLVVLVVLVAPPTSTLACSCAAGAPDREVAFTGRVVAVVEGDWIQERLRQRNEGFGSTVALLEVELMGQGSERRLALVIGGTGQGDCMLRFVPGARYKIKVLEDGRWLLDTNTCIGSRPLNEPAA